MKNTFCAGLLLGLLVVGNAVAADEAEPSPWYQVDLIVFVQKGAPYAGSEYWPEDPGAPDLSQARDLTVVAADAAQTASEATGDAARDVPVEQPFVLLRDTSLPLDSEYQSITRSRLYEPLLHVAWRQPGLAREQAVPVHIFTGMDIPPSPTPAVSDGDTEAAGAVLDGPQAPLRLDGTVKVILSRYLHVETDLVYRHRITVQEADPFVDNLADVVAPVAVGDDAHGPAPVEDLSAPVASETPVPSVVKQTRMQAFRMQQSRRMRSGEIHYLDHPMYGVIVTLTPYEQVPTTPPAATLPVGEPVAPGQAVDLGN